MKMILILFLSALSLGAQPIQIGTWHQLGDNTNRVGRVAYLEREIQGASFIHGLLQREGFQISDIPAPKLHPYNAITNGIFWCVVQPAPSDLATNVWRAILRNGYHGELVTDARATNIYVISGERHD